MKRVCLPVLLCLALAGAGSLSSAGLAADPPPSPTVTAKPIPLPTPPKPQAPKSKSKPKPKPALEVKAKKAPRTRLVLPARVQIGGIPVGKLSPYAAYRRVRAAFARPVVIVAQGRWLRAAPGALGARAYVLNAVKRARGARAGSKVPLTVTVKGNLVRAWVERLAARMDREPENATLDLRGTQPVISPGRPGVAVERAAVVGRIVRSLHLLRRAPVRVQTKVEPAAVSGSGFGPVIVIRRGSNLLQLYEGARLVRTFGVATGQTAYPTPLGQFSIVVRWRNPWWYPPNSAWAAGEEPVPPGPGNPLGTRWMGLSAPGVGIHGTPNDGSIGYSLSHGCIRMHIPEAEWLFEHVNVGTPVFIVPS